MLNVSALDLKEHAFLYFKLPLVMIQLLLLHGFNTLFNFKFPNECNLREELIPRINPKTSRKGCSNEI